MKFVYAIAPSPDGPFKIGRATNVRRRISNIQISSPFKLDCLYAAKTDDYLSAEEALHEAFSSCKLHGEWFDCCLGDILDAASKLGLSFQNVHEMPPKPRKKDQLKTADMSAQEFWRWRKKYFRSRKACAAQIGRSASMIRDLEKGASPIPKYMGLICQAIDNVGGNLDELNLFEPGE